MSDRITQLALRLHCVLCPISLVGLIGPLAQFIPPRVGFPVGVGLLGVAVGIVLSNFCLLVRCHFVVRGSPSPFPLFAGIAAAGGWSLIERCTVFRWCGLLGVFSLLDLFVLPIALGIPAILVAWLFGAKPNATESRKEDRQKTERDNGTGLNTNDRA